MQPNLLAFLSKVWVPVCNGLETPSKTVCSVQEASTSTLLVTQQQLSSPQFLITKDTLESSKAVQITPLSDSRSQNSQMRLRPPQLRHSITSFQDLDLSSSEMVFNQVTWLLCSVLTVLVHGTSSEWTSPTTSQLQSVLHKSFLAKSSQLQLHTFNKLVSQTLPHTTNMETMSHHPSSHSNLSSNQLLKIDTQRTSSKISKVNLNQFQLVPLSIKYLLIQPQVHRKFTLVTWLWLLS